MRTPMTCWCRRGWSRWLGIGGAALAAALATAVLATVGALIAQIVHVTDPMAYLASLGAIVAACLLAAWIPAARAAKVDPIRTLRQE